MVDGAELARKFANDQISGDLGKAAITDSILRKLIEHAFLKGYEAGRTYEGDT